jgi:hypothetical protein
MNKLLLSGLLLPAVGYSQTGFKQTNVASIQAHRWASRAGEYSITLVVVPSAFLFTIKQTVYRVPYHCLANRLVLLGKDTVRLYTNNGRVLRISPVSTRITRAESIELQYATEFSRDD